MLIDEKRLNKSDKEFSCKDEKINILDLKIRNIQKYENSDYCPLCRAELKEISIGNDKEHLEAKRCSECGMIYLRSDYYRRICEKLGVVELRSDIRIMEYPIIEKKEYLIKFDRNENKIIRIVDLETTRCPIHHSKLSVKVINLGPKKKDTVYYCDKCKRRIVGKKHAEFIKNELRRLKQINSFVFEE